jgi:glycine/D-amino acid oxidase-like deaminating enzyme
MLQDAEAVVIGSGALGSSVAFHLAKAGLAPVVLVDKHAIASQTSLRAAGLTSQIRQSELMTRLATMAVDKIKKFTIETNEEMIYFQSGSLKIARTPEHQQQLQRDVELGQKLGVDIDFVSPARAQKLMPFFEPVAIRAVTYVPGDLYLEPGQLPRGYANATARLGGVLLPNTSVTGFAADDGRVTKVITDKGEIRTSIVVDAAGAWSRLVAGLVNSRLGAIPTRHQLIITCPIPGVEPHQPIARVIDCNVYIRPADGGLMLGGYESNPLQFDMASLPAGFDIDDLPLDASVIHRLAGQVVDQFPIFRQITVKEHRGGLPTMTADGEHIVGPLPNLRGFYVASGCCVGGLSIAPIIGEMLAEWIVSGKPPIDLSPLSPSRSAVQLPVEDALREACRRQYACHYWPKRSAEDMRICADT